MKIIRSVADFRQFSHQARSTGFVPTMGALHAGHQSLVERSMNDCELTVVSIFVNPTQFNNPDDLLAYPNTLEADTKLLQRLGVDVLFLPAYEELYADDFRYRVLEQGFSEQLCGRHRPGHFSGVLTVVMKLLNIVRPSAAYFGEKDYQQLDLIRDMVSSFFMEVDIIGCPTVRESDGLAMSSRNLNLDACARHRAARIHELLESSASDTEMTTALNSEGFDVDYIETHRGRRFVAASIDAKGRQVRLIDNVPISAEVH